MKIMDGKRVLFGVNIACPPEVLGEIVVKLPELAMSDCGLTTQATKNMVYVQPSAKAAWTSYLNENPKNLDPLSFSIHDFPVGRIMPIDDYDPSGPIWPTNDGINIFGTPYGSPELVEEYLQRKLAKHEQLLDFISAVTKMGFSREAHKMLIGSTVPMLTQIVKSVPKDDASIGWISAVDDAHLSTWLDCTGASTISADLSS